MSCPVVRAIGEIRGAGLYKDDLEYSSDSVIKLGGTDGPEYVCDNAAFYAMTRKMDMARFELSKPNYEQCKRKYHEFANIVGADYSQLYTRVVDRALNKKFLYKQFVDLVEALGSIEQLIELRVNAHASRGLPINISIPDIFLLPHIDQLIMYRCDILEITINKIIDYVNKINVNAMLREPIYTNISRVKKFSATPPNMSAVVEPALTGNADELLTGMKRIIEQEAEVISYVCEVEKYQCEVINHLNQVHDVCKKIMSGLGFA